MTSNIEKTELEILKEKIEEKRQKQCKAVKKFYNKKYKDCDEEQKKTNTDIRKQYQNSYYGNNKLKIQQRQKLYRDKKRQQKLAEREQRAQKELEIG
tara:strand:- start:110 stop:400 length:291 start_codon:yes stop_codon:yes gene_type:complete